MLSAQEIREKSASFKELQNTIQLQKEVEELASVEKRILETIEKDANSTEISVESLYPNNQATLEKLGYSCVEKTRPYLCDKYNYIEISTKETYSCLIVHLYFGTYIPPQACHE